jgi:hypothetical protein
MAGIGSPLKIPSGRPASGGGKFAAIAGAGELLPFTRASLGADRAPEIPCVPSSIGGAAACV